MMWEIVGESGRGLMQVYDRKPPRKKEHIQYTQTSTFSTGNDPNTFSKPTPNRHRVDILLERPPKQETLKSLNVTC